MRIGHGDDDEYEHGDDGEEKEKVNSTHVMLLNEGSSGWR
jgi:hypothetical protein